ncbi:phenylalanine--tRNA ligase subunit beta [Aquibacillus sp. 3ASR75-11]|uniref:Phenylalanine--tRNA ligase beta subunit n=1 Tax=Terrihalobacillus insolitus TaxID=2950438 RepID=A0A9X3WV22_9BACI|nr:phenylalanine--tRNA ligase subunit beta [Terrihalobacillus insolitus]MDC3412593.1 phenylalanine--tRNA ligase subunit beta [Terrihalobacillus insolitus]MDC3423944.1 phenylalanine--tRNA ligase subunit beta [Terrihalobacillus insolitus]
MFVSWNWLRNYVDIDDIPVEELAEKITKTGIEVEGIEYIAEKSSNVVVGYVKECQKHPNADKLNLCQVDIGEETLQIICGAPNIAKEQKVAVAKPGAVLPGNFKIKKAKLRGIESNGMICSLQELGIEDKFVPKEFAQGIFVFPDDTEVGADALELLNLNDAIIELGLTPNRSDALSMLGVAYEVAAILDRPVHLPEEHAETMTTESASDYINVKVDDPDLNPYYGAFIIKDVTVGPSPLWIRNYLIAAGIRPINNVVDITNYVLLEYGQPLHAFDYDRFGSKEVVVRRASEGEKITTLDDQERSLKPDHLVITNGLDAVAIAGVMGGANSEVHAGTTTVLLEAAYFDPATVRAGSKDHGLRSESSVRFEKGVDPERVKRAGKRASRLLCQYAGGSVCEGVVEFDQLDRTEKEIVIETEKVNARIGTSITDTEIADILRKLNFGYQQDESTFTVIVPTRRQDISIFEDMVEEIARMYGYDNLPYTLPQGTSQAGGLTEIQRLKREVKHFLEGAGLMETITHSLTSKERVHLLVSPEIKDAAASPVELAMPMSEDHSHLRLSMLPELLSSVSYNLARRQSNLGYYEIGTVFVSKEKKVSRQPKEKLRVAGALTGQWVQQPWQQEKKDVDFFLVKGIVEALFDFLNLSVEFRQSEIDGMHPGRTAALFDNGKPLGFIGQIHPNVQKDFDLKETYVFDIDLEYVLTIHKNEPSFNKIPRYPSVTRDIALVVDENLHAGDVKQTIEATGAPLVKEVQIFDVYVGENLPEGKKSIAFNLLYLDPERTLKDEEVEASYQKIVEAVSEKHQAKLRG